MLSDGKTYIKAIDISCYDLSVIGRINHSIATFYLVVTIDDQIQWTTAIKQSNEPKWNDELYFDTSMFDDGLLSIQLYAKRAFGEDSLVAELNTPLYVSTLLANEDPTDHEIREPIHKQDKKTQTHQIQGFIKLNLLRTIGNPQPVSIDLRTEGANNAVKIMSKQRKTMQIAEVPLFGASNGMKRIQGSYNIWRPLVQNIDVFVRIVDDISEIHPYARLAWSVLSLPLKAIVAQSKRDKKIQGLLESMNEIYSYVVDAGPLRLVKSHQRTIQLMCQQTAECAFFITDHASRSFGGRIIKSMTTDYNGKVDGYQQTFKQLRKDFNRESAIVTEITVYQIATKVDDILLELKETNITQKLDGMHFSKTQYRPDPCLVGTRENVIRNIIRWFSQPVADNATDNQLYWLSGVAGCGKSSIARSVAD